jgi:hypothetical protein
MLQASCFGHESTTVPVAGGIATAARGVTSRISRLNGCNESRQHKKQKSKKEFSTLATMLQAGLAMLAVVAFFDAGCEAFSKPTLHALRPPEVGLLRSASPRIAGHSSVSMNEKHQQFRWS